MNPASGLLGQGVFQEAQVNQWLAFAQRLHPVAQEVEADLLGLTKKVNMDAYNQNVKSLKEMAKALNTALNGKTWLVGSQPSLADLVLGHFLTSSFQLILDAGFRKGMPNLAKWFEAYTALPAVAKVSGHIQACAKALKPLA
mmetsp:Transcript_29902/g.45735  ORF Transcript_29902/g.45735 Transcript_29902/m.45735 type:complete len:142 (+) Transcript_29902:2066-2491(+)